MLADKLRILYVDDEENNLTSFKAWFRKEYDITITKSVSEAIELVNNNIFHIIIADQRMPIITGVDFLNKTIEKLPDSIRLLITGQADIEVVIKSINAGQVSKYIAKPWQWDKLQAELENCAQLYKTRIELKLKNQQLQKANEELNKFVYSISHDVRSPLMSILGIVNLSREDKVLEAAPEYFTMIESCVNKLDIYLHNIIDYYRNSRIDDTLQNVDFKTLVNDTIEAHKYLDTSVVFETEIDQKAEFIGDFFRIKIILNNLVSNAVKYQNPNSNRHVISIKANIREKSAFIAVTDNGIGIINEHIKEIFQLFFRGSNPNNANGSGIGLYIVKEALDRIGGNISVTSTPHIRTCFEISIPNHKQ